MTNSLNKYSEYSPIIIKNTPLSDNQKKWWIAKHFRKISLFIICICLYLLSFVCLTVLLVRVFTRLFWSIFSTHCSVEKLLKYAFWIEYQNQTYSNVTKCFHLFSNKKQIADVFKCTCTKFKNWKRGNDYDLKWNWLIL